MPFVVVWENGKASGRLTGEFATEEAAYQAGEEWWDCAVITAENPQEAAASCGYHVINTETAEQGGV